MSYKNKSRGVDVCTMDFGAGAKCYFSSEECAYRGKIRKCPHYQANLMSDSERVEEDNGLANVVKTLGLDRLNGNGKFKNENKKI